MNRAEADRRARRLLRWYPMTWRLRYGEEFKELLIADISECPRSSHRNLDVARSGLAARVTQQPLPRLRIAAAVLTLGAALLGAAILHGIQLRAACGPLVLCVSYRKPGWTDPAAIALCLLGVTGAAGVLVGDIRRLRARRGPLTALVLLGAALLCVWLTSYGRWIITMREPPLLIWPRSDWAFPAAIAVGVLGTMVALLISRPHQTR